VVRAARLLSTTAALLVATASCAGPGPAGPPPAPACQQPPEGVRPESAGSLDETSSGTYCLTVGALIDVYLHVAPPATGRWSTVTSSDPAIVAPRRTGLLTAPVGVTPGIFGGVTPGTATLSSSRPGGGGTWTVTIVVR
jgi:hypothetical protein